MKKIKYMVTSSYSEDSPGTIQDAFILASCDNENRELAFIPPTIKGQCGFIDVVRMTSDPKIFVSVSDDTYANIGKRDIKKMIKNLQDIYDNWGLK
jgi:hypothetical protein